MDDQSYQRSTKGHSIQVSRRAQAALRWNRVLQCDHYISCYDMLLADDADGHIIKRYQLRIFVDMDPDDTDIDPADTRYKKRRFQPPMKALLVDCTGSKNPYFVREIALFTACLLDKTMSLENDTKLECLTFEILLPLLAHIAESPTPNVTVKDVIAFLSRQTTWNNSIFKTIDVYMSPRDLCAPNPRLELPFGYKRSPNSQPFYISNNAAHTTAWIEHLLGVFFDQETPPQVVPVGPLALCLAYLNQRAIDGRALYAMRNDIAQLRALFLMSFLDDEHRIAIMVSITIRDQNTLEIWDANHRVLRDLYHAAMRSSMDAGGAA